jgi:hypothetical protein
LVRWSVVPLAAIALVVLTGRLLACAKIARAGGYFDLLFSDTIDLKAWFASAVRYASVLWLFRLVGLEIYCAERPGGSGPRARRRARRDRSRPDEAAERTRELGGADVVLELVGAPNLALDLEVLAAGAG